MSQRGMEEQSSFLKIEAPAKPARDRGSATRGGADSAWSLRGLAESPELFERFFYGLALVDPDDGKLYLNRRGRELLVPSRRDANGGPWSCCELICNRLGLLLGGSCMAELAANRDGVLPELRMDIDRDPYGGSVWVTASRLDSESSLVFFHLRPGRAGDRRRRTFLDEREDEDDLGVDSADVRLSTLGRFGIDSVHGDVDHEWFEQRPGQLFKYLICHRRRLVTTDQIGTALWPEAGSEDSRNRLRYYVHILREKLEPGRAQHSQSQIIRARRGGYMLDTVHVHVDVDEFVREARAGLAAFVQGPVEPAARHLDAALRLYRGDFLAEDPYAEWAFEERERLHELAGRVLRARVRIDLDRGRLEEAAEYARHLAELEPFDTDVQRLFLEVCLRRGRRSEAVRRYSALRKRMLNSFGQEPDFDLPEVEVRPPGSVGSKVPRF
jgi:DNA-binding SARP family transcriptional activator